MSLVVIGGNSKNIGKTSVVAGLISVLQDWHWTALKITQHEHGLCAGKDEACDRATSDHTFAVTKDEDRSGESDTSRFLAAGAIHSWWVRTHEGHLGDAMPCIRRILAGAENTIIESNSILHFLKPDLYLTVLDPAIDDFKTSAQTFLDRADAVLLNANENSATTVWRVVSLKPVAGRPIFKIRPPSYVTPEIVEFIRSRLGPS